MTLESPVTAAVFVFLLDILRSLVVDLGFCGFKNVLLLLSSTGGVISDELLAKETNNGAFFFGRCTADEWKLREGFNVDVHEIVSFSSSIGFFHGREGERSE